MTKTRICLAVLSCAAVLSALPFAAYPSELSALCAEGEVFAVRELLDNGANPNEMDEEGHTPLTRTVLAGVSAPLSAHLKIIELLCQAGADVNAEAGGVTPLHRAVAKGPQFLEMTLLLLEMGASPNVSGTWGTALHVAAGPGVHPDHVRLLLRWGADVHAADSMGIEPLAAFAAADDPSYEKVELLLSAGANVNALFDWGGHHGLSALMLAAVNGTPEIVRLLLDQGALRFARSEENLSAYDYARLAGRADNADLLR